jgi:DMSO/TMAO reductase YedYZ molybdopterin-dependent catalytic subunit
VVLELEVDPAKVRPTPAAPKWAAALAGLLAGASAVVVGTLVAGIIDVRSPIDAVGTQVINHAPVWLIDVGKQVFGTGDKAALRTGIIVILVVVAAVLGIESVRRRWIGVAGIIAFGVFGIVCALGLPDEPASTFVPALLGSLVGAVVLVKLVPRPPGPRRTPQTSQVPLGWDRRQFLVTSGVVAGAVVVVGGVGTALQNKRVDAVRDTIPDTQPPAAPPPIPAGADGLVDGTPYITPNGDFYRIDTAFSFPRIELTKWKVDIKGMVDNPLSFSYADLTAMPQVQRVITMTCVSNGVGGDLVGNAVWQGVLLKDLLDQAGVDPAAEQVYSTSIDGFTTGFPVSVAMDGRDAMVAIGMNGKALPLEHGFPARLVVPGLYGYVSATKWLRTIELNRWRDAEGYWIPLGWDRDGPIKTESRIDVPRSSGTLDAGTTVIAGVAWAQHRGIAKVEVRVDDGPWNEATLAADVTDDSWRQWSIPWPATSGRHTLQVRATDKTGETQTDQVRSPAPNGASGYHTRRVTVR